MSIKFTVRFKGNLSGIKEVFSGQKIGYRIFFLSMSRILSEIKTEITVKKRYVLALLIVERFSKSSLDSFLSESKKSPLLHYNA